MNVSCFAFSPTIMSCYDTIISNIRYSETRLPLQILSVRDAYKIRRHSADCGDSEDADPPRLLRLLNDVVGSGECQVVSL